MNKPNDGGPAFPRPKWWPSDGDPDADGHPQGGMSLLDYFAGKALPACIQYAYSERHYDPALIAEQAYEAGAAMVVAGEKVQRDPLRELYVRNLEGAAFEMRAALKGLLDVCGDFLTHEQQNLLENYLKHAKDAIAKAEAAGVKS